MTSSNLERFATLGVLIFGSIQLRKSSDLRSANSQTRLKGYNLLLLAQANWLRRKQRLLEEGRICSVQAGELARNIVD
jgi:hypothetical protein